MPKSSRASKSRSDAPTVPKRVPGARIFGPAVFLLCAALLLILISAAAARRGDAVPAGVFASAALAVVLWLGLLVLSRTAPRLDFNGWHSPFSFGITRAGTLFIAAVILLALAAVRTGNNLLYLILSIQLAAVAVSGAAARLSLRALTLSLQVPQNVFEGDQVSVKISLRNRKRRLTSFSISVEDPANRRKMRRRLMPWKSLMRKPGEPAATGSPPPVVHHAAYFPAIPPGESRAELISQSFPRRGLYHLDGLHISTRFPFGLFRRGEQVPVHGDILVYPSLREVSSYFHLLPFLPGRLEGKRVGHGESLYAVRRYRDGESARMIHWKATAKTGRLMTREYALEEESEFCLILDTILPSSRNQALEEFERAVSLAASLAAHFIREGAELEVLTPAGHIPRGAGTEHLYGILRFLAVIQGEPAGPGPEPELVEQFSGLLEKDRFEKVFSGKMFKIILTSRARPSLPADIRRSSHVIYFDEL